MLKYGNLDLDPKKTTYLTQLFRHVEEVTNTFQQELTQYLGIVLRQFVVINAFLTENNRIWFCVFCITFGYLGTKANITNIK